MLKRSLYKILPSKIFLRIMKYISTVHVSRNKYDMTLFVIFINSHF